MSDEKTSLLDRHDFRYVGEGFPTNIVPWTSENDLLLQFLFNERYTVAEIALKMSRLPPFIRHKLSKLGLDYRLIDKKSSASSKHVHNIKHESS